MMTHANMERTEEEKNGFQKKVMMNCLFGGETQRERKFGAPLLYFDFKWINGQDRAQE